MSRTNQAYQNALTAVEQLPAKLRIRLFEHVLTATEGDENILFVGVRHPSAAMQSRLAELMDKNNEGQLTPFEQTELKQLVAESDEMALANARALARLLRPDLFDEKGRATKKRIKLALKSPPAKNHEPKQKARQV